MFDPPLPRWAARILLATYAWGFVSAVVILGGLVAKRVMDWLRKEGGW